MKHLGFRTPRKRSFSSRVLMECSDAIDAEQTVSIVRSVQTLTGRATL